MGAFVAAVLVWMGTILGRVPHAQSPEPVGPVSDSAEARAILKQYCTTCHNERLKTGGLALDTADLANIAEHGELWEKVARKLRARVMPPQGARRPTSQTYDRLVTWLETELDRAAVVTPGPAMIHRLNRAEYGNAIRDLLALNVDVETLLPPDDAGYGFDNVADQLRLSPALLEQYLSAADKISALAVGVQSIDASDVTYRTPPDRSQDAHVEGLPLGTRGGVLIDHVFPLNAEYVIKPKLWRSNSGFLRGLMHPHDLEITIDGKRVHLATIGGNADFAPLITHPLDTEAVINARTQVRLSVAGGPHAVGVTFVQKSVVAPLELLQPFPSALDPFDSNGMPQVDAVTITGPFKATGPGTTPSRRRIFVCRPQNPKDEDPCARRILSTLARRAYRRPATAGDIQRLEPFYRLGQRKGGFDAGIAVALRRILTDPEFIFRIERDDGRLSAGAVHRVSDTELASRLSFFLWSSIPDDQLLRLASAGTLHQPAVLEREVRRMLADSKSSALVENFAGQWLYLRNLQGVTPDRILFPDFDDNLRQAFDQELELFFESIIREDRSVLDLLTADYTFVNERLAKHYGIPDVYGSYFRRVQLTDNARKGLLGKGAILTVTSHADRTSPVVRGKWILDNLLGLPPAPPPPNVPSLADDSATAPRSLRAQMEQHRASPTCASCHKVMDPIGFALENFDAIGAWRTRDGGGAIDASGQLADGTKVDGPVTLAHALRPDLFVETMTEKLLTYALGRGLTYKDGPMTRKILRDAASHDYRFSSLVLGIVDSVPFQMRMKPAAGTEDEVARAAGVR